MQKINLREKFSTFSDCWKPKIVGEVNDSYVKLAKLSGEFIWHKHEHEDELFLVVKGALTIKLRDKEVHLKEGEFFIVPKGVEHLPIANEEAHVVLIEPKTTINTGNIKNNRTVETLERL